MFQLYTKNFQVISHSNRGLGEAVHVSSRIIPLSLVLLVLMWYMAGLAHGVGVHLRNKKCLTLRFIVFLKIQITLQPRNFGQRRYNLCAPQIRNIDSKSTLFKMNRPDFSYHIG